jgi:hypothetical protein
VTDAPKYERGDEPGLEVEFSDLAAQDDQCGTGFEVMLSGDDWFETQDDAERARQEYALAIADSVHGAELARLRSVEDAWVDLVKRLRAAMIEHMRWEKSEGSGLPLRGHVMEVFDEASIAVGLPASDDDGVPFELQPPASAFKPTLAMRNGYFDLRWGTADHEHEGHSSLEMAVERYGERYAAWKAAQR